MYQVFVLLQNVPHFLNNPRTKVRRPLTHFIFINSPCMEQKEIPTRYEPFTAKLLHCLGSVMWNSHPDIQFLNANATMRSIAFLGTPKFTVKTVRSTYAQSVIFNGTPREPMQHGTSSS